MQVVFKFSLRWCPQLLLLLNSAPEFLNLSSLVCAKHHEYENRSCWNKTAWSSHAHNYSSEEQVASDELSPSHHWYCSAHPCKEQSIWIGDSVTTAHKELAQGSTEQKVQGEIPTGKRKQTNKKKFSSSRGNSVNAYKESLTAGEMLKCLALLSAAFSAQLLSRTV